jgi:hypothetical protein
MGVAPVIVFSDGGRPDAPSARRCLLRLDGVRVACLSPRTSSTLREGAALLAVCTVLHGAAGLLTECAEHS